MAVVAILTRQAAACRDSRRRPRGDTWRARDRVRRRSARSRPSTAARRASARTRRASPGRRRACACPAVVQADGRIVVAGQRAGAVTLARFNANGTLDTTYGTGGFVRHASPARRRASPGASAATALALDRRRRRARHRVRRLAVDVRRALLARRRDDRERRLLRPAPDRLHRVCDRAARRRQRRDRRAGARPLARHALQVLRCARRRAGHGRLGTHATAAAPGAPRRRPARRSAPPEW